MLKPKKNLVSFIRATVKPEYQDEVLSDVTKKYNNGYTGLFMISANTTLHGIFVATYLDDILFDGYDPNGWNDGQKYKPVKDGIYKIRFSNGGEYLRRWKDGKWYDLTGTVESDVSRTTFTEFKWFSEDID